MDSDLASKFKYFIKNRFTSKPEPRSEELLNDMAKK